jgi:hypothetical protein
MYLLIENFNSGLDTRRMFLTSKAGSLQKLVNAHINRGGEIEKRLAFTTFASIPSGTFGLQAASNSLYVFGSAAQPSGFPANLIYQRLQHPSGQAMTDIVYSETYNGKIYAVAKFADGAVYHYYDGNRVTAWDSISSVASSNTLVASNFAAQIDATTPFIATNVGSVVTITNATPNQAFTASASVSGSSQTVTFSTTQNAAAGVSATSSFNFTASATTGTVTAVTVNGTNVLSGSVAGLSTVNATASAVAAAITVGGYSATASGPTVTITAPAGAAYNSYTPTITITGTGVTAGTASQFSSGVDAKPQITTATIGGTFSLNTLFTIRLQISATSFDQTFSLLAVSSGASTVVRTFNNKLYSLSGSNVFFSNVNDPTAYSYLSTPTTPAGSGVINMSNQDNGFETLTAMGVYQGKLAIFGRRTVQTWTMDPDPTKNASIQTLKNIGTFAPKSVVNFGDIDVFFLSDTGIRSLRARDASNAATVSDIGTNIDTLVQSDLVSLNDTVKFNAVGIIEPIDGRYWLAVGNKIYVYSYFPSASIAAWSTYEPGFSVSQFAYASGRVYARSGNTVYIYGGTDGQTYDNSQVEVILPYIDGGKPAHTKTFTGIDMACTGTWNVFVGLDTSVPDSRDFIAQVPSSTYGFGNIEAVGTGTHMGVRLVTDAAYSGPAKIGNFTVHFQIGDSG